jgi:hypothetical protein
MYLKYIHICIYKQARRYIYFWVHVYMYVIVCVCMYVYMYVCMHACSVHSRLYHIPVSYILVSNMNMCVHVCVHASGPCMYACVLHTCFHIHACVCWYDLSKSQPSDEPTGFSDFRDKIFHRPVPPFSAEECNKYMKLAIAQALTRWSLTAEVRIVTPVTSSEIHRKQVPVRCSQLFPWQPSSHHRPILTHQGPQNSWENPNQAVRSYSLGLSVRVLRFDLPLDSLISNFSPKPSGIMGNWTDISTYFKLSIEWR